MKNMSKKSERSKKKVRVSSSFCAALHAGRPSIRLPSVEESLSCKCITHGSWIKKAAGVPAFIFNELLERQLAVSCKLSSKLVGTMGLVLVQQQASAQYYQTIQEKESQNWKRAPAGCLNTVTVTMKRCWGGFPVTGWLAAVLTVRNELFYMKLLAASARICFFSPRI